MNYENAPVAKVIVEADGRILYNGQESTIEDLRLSFARLAENKGVVWYHRDATTSEPPPNAKLVIEAIIAARLPVSLSTKRDFSDAVQADGTAKPR